MIPTLLLALLKTLLMLAAVAFVTLVILRFVFREQLCIMERMDRYAKR